MSFYTQLSQQILVNVLEYVTPDELQKIIFSFSSVKDIQHVLKAISYLNIISLVYESLWLYKYNNKVRKVSLEFNGGMLSRTTEKSRELSKRQIAKILNEFNCLESILIDLGPNFSLDSWVLLSFECLSNLTEISFMFEKLADVEVEHVDMFFQHLSLHCKHLKTLVVCPNSKYSSYHKVTENTKGIALQLCAMSVQKIKSPESFVVLSECNAKAFHYQRNTANKKTSVMIGCNCNHSQDDSELQSFFSDCGNFSEIALRHFSFQLSSELMDTLVTNNPQLESFQFDFSHYSGANRSCSALLHLVSCATGLKKLVLHHLCRDQSMDLDLLHTFPLPNCLKTLSFYWCSGVETKQVIQLLEQNRGIEHIEIEHCEHVDLAEVRACISQLTTNRAIELTGTQYCAYGMW